MRGLYRVLGALSLGVVLVGCGATDDDNPTARVRAFHAVPDAPAVDVAVNDLRRWEGVDYREGTGYVEVEAGQTDLAVDGQLPGGETRTVIGPVQQQLDPDRIYTVVALGTVDDPQALVIARPQQAIAAGAARVRALHAAPAAPQVDVYVTAPDADLSASAPIGSFAFGETSDSLELAPGEYQIRLTPAGDAATVVFDSGRLSLADAQDLLISAVENTGPGDSPVQLVVLEQDGVSNVLWDVGTPALLRAVHASPDAPAVDLIVNDDFANPLVEDLAFPNATDYLQVDPDQYNLKVTAANNPGAIVIDTDLELGLGDERTALAVGTLAAIEPLLLADDNRPVATAAKLRLVHAAPSQGAVDVYLAPAGTDLTTVDPTVAGFAFRDNTGYLQVEPGQYQLTVTGAGGNNVLIGPSAVDLTAGGVYTGVAREAAGGGLPLGLILLDDF